MMRYTRTIAATLADIAELGHVVEAVTTWAMLDRATGRVRRVTAESAAPFLGD